MTTQAKIDSTPVSLPAAADLSTKLFRFGKITATGVNVCSVAGERADGIIGAQYKKTPAVGDAVDLYIERLPIVEAGEAFDAGISLTTDANGKAVAAGDGDVVNAVSIDASTAAGQYVRVRPPFAKATEAGTIANSAVDPASVTPGVPVLIAHTFADAATATYEFTNDDKLEIVDAWAIKDGAGAANTIQITDAADAAITNAMAFAVDKTVTHAGTIDKAKRTLAAAAGYKVVNTRAAGSSAGQLFILAIKRA